MTVSPLSFLSSPAPSKAPSRAPAATAYPARFPERTTLTRRDRVVARAVAEAMFSQDGEIDAARLDAHVDEFDAFISNASRSLRTGLRIALFVVRLAPVLLFFRMRMLESLSVDERVVVLTRLERSRLAPLSLAFIGWRAVMTMIVYEHPTELASLGYGEERKVHKRRLALVESRAAEQAEEHAMEHEGVALVAPPAEASGVRLRGHGGDHEGDRDSDAPAPAAAAVVARKRDEVA